MPHLHEVVPDTYHIVDMKMKSMWTQYVIFVAFKYEVKHGSELPSMHA